MERLSCTRRRALLATGAGVGAALAGCFEGTRTDREPGGNGAEGPGSGDAGQSGENGDPIREDGENATGPDAGQIADQAPDDAAAVIAVGPEERTVFEPQETEVSRRDTVAWVWASDGHTVTPTSQPEAANWQGEQEIREEGYVLESAFQVPGTYEYVCEPHAEAEMRGTLTVTE